MNKEDAATDFDITIPAKWLILILAIFGAVYYLFFKIFGSFSFPKTKYSKQELAKYYGVDKKTFNKWQVFWQNSYGILADYPKRKLLNIIEASFIMYKLGDPKDFPVMSKKEIIELAEGSYKSLRGSVKKYPDYFGIKYEDFTRMKKFPPIISKQIKEQYG